MIENKHSCSNSWAGRWFACALIALGAITAVAQAQGTETVLFNFAALPNGATPYAGVIIDVVGRLYGTASVGGAFNLGVVFRINQGGGETVLYSFPGGKAGSQPMSSLFRDAAGNLYGTAAAGGAGNHGVVYKLDVSGQETVLHSFMDGADGKNPQTGVILDGAGHLYGTTQYGGASHAGVMYMLDEAGHETIVHSFTGGADGGHPIAGLTLDAAGNLYGTTAYGGYTAGHCRGDRRTPPGCGVVFKVDAAGNFSVVYTFGTAGVPEGLFPNASVTLDPDGNIYGTTWNGGTAGIGAVYKIDTAFHQTVLHSFTGPDGQYADSAVVRDASGNLYGTTYYGGTGDCGGYSCGLVYKLDTTGNETVLYGFKGTTDGGIPFGVVMDTAGNLYGATQVGGPAYLGAVFKLDAAGNETTLYALTGGVAGNSPRSALIRDSSGNLYGTTYYGGPANNGMIYRMDASGQEAVIYSFPVLSGIYPSGNIVLDSAGNIYGTAVSGNGCCEGVLYMLDTTGKQKVLASFPANDQLIPGVVRDPAGNLYVTTNGGSGGHGVVYKVPPSGQTMALYKFTGGADGGTPWGNVTLDAAGNLYGTTSFGGRQDRGVVFKLSPSGQETVLYNFTLTAGVDGGAPSTSVTLDSAGNIYGTTGWGGTASAGTVFKLDTSGHESILYSFTQSWPAGPIPYSSLVLDSAGNIYGTTLYGGGTACENGYGCGTVYRVDASGQFTLLHALAGGDDGSVPMAPVLLDNAGHLFGTACSGGKRLGGVLFKITL